MAGHKQKIKTEYIQNVTTLEELKQEYKKLAMLHHPDVGGKTETMQEINREYDELFQQLKSTHKNKEGEYYTKETTEAPEEWREIISKLLQLKMQNVKIEVVGSFVWISGDTKPHKEKIKEIANFKWSKNKLAWYLSPKDYRRYGGEKEYSFSEIRKMYRSATIIEEKSKKAIAQ